MTDARIPERWLNDRRLLRLSDSAFRSFVTTLVWSVSNRSDGHLASDDLQFIPGCSPGRTPELVEAGLWLPGSAGWLIVDFETTQTKSSELAMLERARAKDREKKARQRANQRQQSSDHADARPASSGDSPPGQSPGTAQARTGQARTGQDRTTVESYQESVPHLRVLGQTDPWSTDAEQVRMCESCRSPLDRGLWDAGERRHASC